MRLSRLVAVFAVALLAGATGRADDGTTPNARLAAIDAAQKAASARYGADLEKVERTEEAQRPARERYLAELHKHVEAALVLARAHPGDPAAFEALKFVIRTNRAGPGDATARALRLILERGDFRTARQGPYLGHAALILFQYPDAETLLRRVLDENPNRDDRGDACYWLATHLRQQARMVRRLREKPGDMKDYEKYTAAQPIAQLVREKDPDALDKASEALLERVVKNFADVRTNDDPRSLASIAEGELFAARNLRIGKTAPDIAGADHEGKGFKLSDFRGKVVVLTFSGNWCGPCRGMYPQERELVAKLKDKPFALVSVNTDKDKGALLQSIRAGEITWRCWCDGGTDGPISTRWGVTGFPTIFVLDPAGTIRFKDVRGDDLDRAVAALFAETEISKSSAR
jgi:thiol-disulfide isomerase/thioredoxin